MPTEAVLDASAIVALYTPEEHSEWVRKEVDGYASFHALDLTFYEAANALWKKFRVLKELRETELKEALQGIWRFMDGLCLIHPYKEVREESLIISIKYALTIYDSSYLALAKSLNVKLVTIDVKLYEKLKGTPLHKIVICPPAPD
ncbi:TPA: PIN domain-containing protein [Candidatus Bathyarchaeota archaeon]|nr:PIN domain-containing protein [Candidatus Bathyarchaeota archaeon]